MGKQDNMAVTLDMVRKACQVSEDGVLRIKIGAQKNKYVIKSVSNDGTAMAVRDFSGEVYGVYGVYAEGDERAVVLFLSRFGAQSAEGYIRSVLASRRPHEFEEGKRIIGDRQFEVKELFLGIRDEAVDFRDRMRASGNVIAGVKACEQRAKNEKRLRRKKERSDIWAYATDNGIDRQGALNVYNNICDQGGSYEEAVTAINTHFNII